MGRVEEAMRRAADVRSKKDGVFGAEEAAVAVPIAEAFPHESPERPRLRPVTPASDLPLRAATVRSEGTQPAAAGSLPERLDTRLTRKTVVDDHTDPISREQYRRLAATLHATQAENGLKVVMIASALAGEGKTLTATNLALTFSESYHRNVLLIDADLRKPSLHAVFNLNAGPGLSDGLTSQDEGKLPIHQVSTHLTVLTAGSPNADPMAALASERARRLIEEARQTFDWVIIDTPPIGILSDASLLAAAADGTILVVKAGSTSCELVQRALAALGRERVLGVVLNRVTEDIAGLGHKYYGGYYAGQSPASGGHG